MTVHNVTNSLKSIRSAATRSLKLAATALLVCGLSACDDKNEPGTPQKPLLPEGRTYISMMVHSGESSGSRADWEGPTWGDFYTEESAESKFETTIDPTRIHICLYDEDGKTVADLNSGSTDYDVIINTISEAEGIHQLFFDITNLNLEEDKEYVAAVFANYNTIPSAQQIDNSYFTLQTLIGAGGGVNPVDYYKGRMPMFGFIRWTYGTYADPDSDIPTPIIGTVEMMRSVCKIEVTLGDPDIYPRCKNLTIDTGNAPHLAYVRGRHINTRGHIAPAKSTWLDPAKTTTRNLSFTDSFFELTGNRWTSETSEHLNLPGISADGRKFYIYLPEASGLSLAPYFDALRLSVTVNYTPDDGSPARSITGTLFPSIFYDEANQQYPAYVNYNRWKLTRNHIYRFTITDIANETSFKYRVSQSGQQIVDVPTFD